jgi:HSP20 family protein
VAELCHDDLVRDFHRILLSSEVRELTDEVGRLFEDLDRTRPVPHAPHGHCSPALDVLQTESAVEVVVDLPGVSADRVRVLFKQGVLVLVGEKPSPYTADRVDGTFHLVERGFGRFARAVRVDGAVDGGAARAVLNGGELRVIVPKIPERRGQEILVPITIS